MFVCECGARLNNPTYPVRCYCGKVYRSRTASPSCDRLPLWVRAIRRLRTPEDRGVGDTVARIAAKFGGERFKRFSQRIGIPCGCTRKQAEWNERWPYRRQKSGTN